MRTLVVSIGRSDQCDIAVKDGSMSGKHAEVSKFNGEIKVKDTGSANGIYVNGEKVEEAELFDGDILRLGPVPDDAIRDAHRALVLGPEEALERERDRRRPWPGSLAQYHRLGFHVFRPSSTARQRNVTAS